MCPEIERVAITQQGEEEEIDRACYYGGMQIKKNGDTQDRN